MAKVWADLSGTMETLFKFGQHSIRSFTNRVAIQNRIGNSTLLSVEPTSYTIGGRTFYSSAAIPTAGTYVEGDIVWNTNPSANSLVGWFCIQSGTPGVWLPFNASGQLTVVDLTELNAISPTLLEEGYIAFVVNENTRYEYRGSTWVVFDVATLDAEGKLPAAILPAIAITDTFVVADQASMLALTAQQGDVAVREDVNRSFILKVEPATEINNWVRLASPTDAGFVTSVNALTGTVTLTPGDIGLGNVNNTSDLAKPISNAMQTALDNKQNKVLFPVGGMIESPSDKTFTLLTAPQPLTVVKFSIGLSAGTCTATLQSNGVDITGAASIGVTTTTQNISITTGNTVATDTPLTLVISNVSSAVDMVFTVSYQV
jgi:hypothetical protein